MTHGQEGQRIMVVRVLTCMVWLTVLSQPTPLRKRLVQPDKRSATLLDHVKVSPAIPTTAELAEISAARDRHAQLANA
jgi:hypothetical protein